MGQGITLNKITKFEEVNETKEWTNEVTIDNRKDYEKCTFRKSDDTIGEYKIYNVKYRKKIHTKTPIVISNKQVFDYMSDFEFKAYRKNSNYIFTISKLSHTIVQSGMKKINKKNSIKSEFLKIDLIDFIEKSITNNTGIEICGGWFGNLKLPNLDSVSLSGDDVNKSSDWQRFKSINTAKITNIKVILNLAPFNGIKITLSSKGFIYLYNDNLEVEKLLEIAEKIIEINNLKLV